MQASDKSYVFESHEMNAGIDWHIMRLQLWLKHCLKTVKSSEL